MLYSGVGRRINFGNGRQVEMRIGSAGGIDLDASEMWVGQEALRKRQDENKKNETEATASDGDGSKAPDKEPIPDASATLSASIESTTPSDIQSAAPSPPGITVRPPRHYSDGIY